MLDTLLINIGQLLTMDQEDGLLRREAMNTLPVIENGAVGIENGVITFVGTAEEAKGLQAKEVIDCGGKWFLLVLLIRIPILYLGDLVKMKLR